MLVFFSVMISMFFLLMASPLMLSVMIIVQTALLSIIMSVFLSTPFLSFLMYMLFVTAMMVVFLYVSSLAHNTIFLPPYSHLYFLPLPVITLISIVITSYLPPMKTTCSTLSDTFHGHTLLSFTALYKPVALPLTVIIIIFLLLVLVTVVNITAHSKAPLRHMI